MKTSQLAITTALIAAAIILTAVLSTAGLRAAASEPNATPDKVAQIARATSRILGGALRSSL